jgi:phosphoglycolate phosphatase
LPELVLFDLDGTLSDPLEGIGRSINHALIHFGHQPRALAELAAYVGPPLDETFSAITGVTRECDIAALVAKYRERYADIGYSENILYPGIAAALTALSEAKVAMAVCTSKRVDFAEQILEMFGLRQHFRFVDGGEIGRHKWQQIEALQARGLVSSASIMVGDRAVDMIAAHRNGLRSGAVLWGYGSRAELANERPHCWLGSPDELPRLAGASPEADI